MGVSLINSSAVNPAHLDRLLNTFAVRCFRDMADADYIAARMACRAGLMHQFLWSSQQAIEKYLKAILLFNRIPATKVKHDLAHALKLTKKLDFKVELRPQSQSFFDHVATYGAYRYLEVSNFVVGHALLDLDMTVWDIRRYCQCLTMPGGDPTPTEARVFELTLENIQKSTEKPPHLFRIFNGHIEDIIDNKKHPAREPLLWQNAFFSPRRRKNIKVVNQLQFTNAPLWHHPEMLSELLQYVFMPNDLIKGYGEHLATVLSDPSKRP